MSATTPTMLLVTAAWQGKKPFKLMPISNDCPFSEGIFDSDSKLLVMMSSKTKDTIHMVPRLDENGDPIALKSARKNGKTFKEHRIQLETYTEHYVIEKKEVIDLIQRLAANADTYNYMEFLEESALVKPEPKKIELIK
jgi:uncharacterized protein Veg